MAKDSALQNTGFEWRTLLGPCHEWPAPTIEGVDADPQLARIERCEVCRQPVDSGKPYLTNSAGEQAIHLACLQEHAEAAERNQHRSSRPVWRRLLGFAHV